MNRRIRMHVFVGVLILLVGIGIGIQFSIHKECGSVGAGGKQITLNSEQITGNREIDQQANDVYVGEYMVARVIDGDTIEIEGGERVRYIGMDTPETVDPKKPVQCFGKEASEENRSLVEGKTVRLEKDTSDRDQYGRLLRYVYVGDTFVNLQLVSLGFARADAFPPDTKYQNRITTAKDAARSAGLGLWKTCVK